MQPCRLQEVKLSLQRSRQPTFAARSSADVARAMRHLADEVRESLVALFLSAANQVICVDRISTGGLSSTTVEPAEIIRTALLVGARATILCHNHPSGSVDPSPDDHQVTQRVADAAALFDIQLLDHVIIGAHGKHYSFLDAQSLPKSRRPRTRTDASAPTHLVSWIETDGSPSTVIERVHLAPAQAATLTEALARLEQSGRILDARLLSMEEPPLSYETLLSRHPFLQPRPSRTCTHIVPASADQLRLEVA
jgi:hypothetical protein